MDTNLHRNSIEDTSGFNSNEDTSGFNSNEFNNNNNNNNNKNNKNNCGSNNKSNNNKNTEINTTPNLFKIIKNLFNINILSLKTYDDINPINTIEFLKSAMECIGVSDEQINEIIIIDNMTPEIWDLTAEDVKFIDEWIDSCINFVKKSLTPQLSMLEKAFNKNIGNINKFKSKFKNYFFSIILKNYKFETLPFFFNIIKAVYMCMVEIGMILGKKTKTYVCTKVRTLPDDIYYLFNCINTDALVNDNSSVFQLIQILKYMLTFIKRKLGKPFLKKNVIKNINVLKLYLLKPAETSRPIPQELPPAQPPTQQPAAQSQPPPPPAVKLETHDLNPIYIDAFNKNIFFEIPIPENIKDKFKLYNLEVLYTNIFFYIEMCFNYRLNISKNITNITNIVILLLTINKSVIYNNLIQNFDVQNLGFLSYIKYLIELIFMSILRNVNISANNAEQVADIQDSAQCLVDCIILFFANLYKYNTFINININNNIDDFNIIWQRINQHFNDLILNLNNIIDEKKSIQNSEIREQLKPFIDFREFIDDSEKQREGIFYMHEHINELLSKIKITNYIGNLNTDLEKTVPAPDMKYFRYGGGKLTHSRTAYQSMSKRKFVKTKFNKKAAGLKKKTGKKSSMSKVH